MDRDDIIKMAREAGLPYEYDTKRILHLKQLERFAALVAATDKDDIIKMAKQAKLPYEYDTERVLHLKELERFAALVAATEREKVAAWMIARGYATGHGDTIEDLLNELDWQIREQEREACIDIVAMHGGSVEIEAAIRARGEQ